MRMMMGITRACRAGITPASTAVTPRAPRTSIPPAFRCAASLAAALALALPPAARADMAPCRAIVIPEAIWAPATGGGTWVTAVQVTAKVAGSVIYAQFFYGSYHMAVTVATSTADHQTFRFPNILETMQALDTEYFTYYGRVGSLGLYTDSDARPIWAQAMTTNGNFGKTMPGFNYESTANSADIGRDLVIPGVVNDSTYRFFVGAFNVNSASMAVDFHLMTSAGTMLGSVARTIPSYGFTAFNPFTELGITAPSSNLWLRISPVTNGGGFGNGLFCFGSLANNVSNDTFSMIAIPFE